MRYFATTRPVTLALRTSREHVQISLLTSFSIFIFLTVIQYFVGIFITNTFNFDKHKIITGFQFVITLFCIWVSASPAKETIQFSTGMFIASYLIYVPYSFKKSGST
ncbi:hypothetical protein GAB14E_2373 [Colwellia psychrerythraea]|uniref:Uncharacterized protein n=1 Tax=Colwellia psychrerythraea TaxID=28229 RepID=A0A099KVY8_COLPS|nr:hypothetical protein GAB14E_2373 [Colwellia psychrerythraea]